MAISSAKGPHSPAIIDLRPNAVEQQQASFAHRQTERATNRARYVLWTLRQPGLRGGPPFRIGPRARVRLAGDGRLERGRHLVIAEDFSCVAQGPVRFGDDVYLNRGVYVSSHAGVNIGNRCRLGERVSIHDEHHLEESPNGPAVAKASPIEIGDGVWLGANTVVLSGVTIGRGTVVGANSIVSTDLPGGVLAAGSPAVVIKKLGVPSGELRPVPTRKA